MGQIGMEIGVEIWTKTAMEIVSRNHPSMDAPYVWLDHLGASPGVQSSSTAVDVASIPADDAPEIPHMQEATLQTAVEGYEDIDLSMLSDMELSSPASQHIRWPHTVATLIGLLKMDEPTFDIFKHFEAYQGLWLSHIDHKYALSMLFQSE
jgi:hypothetical protein